MTVRVHYADVDGEEQRINRDTYHTDHPDMLIAYNHANAEAETGVENKVSIPLHRIVKVVE